MPDPAPRSLLRLPVLVGGSALVLWGWTQFYFVLDDAFIAFRYVSNALAGRGYVWNPAPFLPVEGYTSFLWVALLEGLWRTTGVEPPLGSNLLSLAASLGSLWLSAAWLDRLRAPGWAWALALIGIASNRSFLTWTSSGLEAALFNLLLLAWAFMLTAPASPRQRAATAGLAALLALTRPDGLLFLAASGAWWGLEIAQRRASARGSTPLLQAHLLPALPTLAVAIHLLWRHSFYGAWLPNTYYAKLAGAWPEAGLTYFACFAVEYALYCWPIAAVIGAWYGERGGEGRGQGAGEGSAADPIGWLLARPWIVAAAAVLAHLGYYLVRVGGDHFEYRVLTQLVPLAWISGAWLAGRARIGVAALALWLLLSLPIPWTHWALTHDRMTREETFGMVVPVAPHLPMLRPLAAWWDAQQEWLIRRAIGDRHQEHKVFALYQQARLPTRDQGSRLSWDDRLIQGVDCVGVVGWMLPNVAIIDLYGLNDRTIARSPTRADHGDTRRLAHERVAPPEYLACWAFNLGYDAKSGRMVRYADVPKMGDDDIRRCDQAFVPGSREGE